MNWEINNLQPPTDIFRDMFILDELNFFVIAGRKIFRTQDGGNTWTTQADFTVQFLRTIVFTDDQNGWLIGKTAGSGHPNFRTTNGGGNWFQSSRNFTSIYFIDSLVGYAVEEGNVLKTTNKGNTWWQVSETPNSFANWTTNMSFVDEANGWTWDYFDVYQTIDSGRTWIKSNSINQIENVFDGGLFMLNKDLGWAVGSGGYIFKYTSEGISSVKDVEFNSLTNYSLFQNYPNPFNPLTKITYSIPQFSFVTLKVYEVLGNEIAILVNEEKPVGSYEVEFDGSELTSGVYFYRIQASDYVETKKMTLIK